MIDQDKPLSAWTLGEVQQLCASRKNCEGCLMARGTCFFEKPVCPCKWELMGKPRFTQEEVAVMKHMFSAGIVSIKKTASTHLYWEGADVGGVMVVPPGFLPALRPGQSVRLEDILEDT